MDPQEHPSNEELISRLAGRDAAHVLMERYSALSQLATASLDELVQIRGIGRSKAAAIKSAFLLAQRLSQESFPDNPVMDTPERVADYLRERNRLFTVEVFQVLLLNTRRRLIGVQMLSQGTLDTILVHPRDVFIKAVTARAAAIVVAHNLCAAAHKLCYGQRRIMCSASVASSLAAGQVSRRKECRG